MTVDQSCKILVYLSIVRGLESRKEYTTMSDDKTYSLGKKPLREGDYLLTHAGAWFTLKGFSIRLVGTDEGVVVNIYANGRELEDALATTQAFDSEIEEAIATEDRALVEAAPDLLHALRDALDIIEGTGLDASIQRAAIAKATGGAA